MNWLMGVTQLKLKKGNKSSKEQIQFSKAIFFRLLIRSPNFATLSTRDVSLRKNGIMRQLADVLHRNFCCVIDLFDPCNFVISYSRQTIFGS